MIKFVFKRLLYLVPVIFGVTFMVYLLMTIASGNPEEAPLRGILDEELKEAKREELGLNDPILVRYGRMLKKLFSLDHDRQGSLAHKMSVHLPKSLMLCFTALFFSVVLALPLGIIAALKQNTLFDGVCMVISLIGVSMPNFWLGLMMMIVFALEMNLLPTSGSDTWAHLVLPAATLAFINMAAISRSIRSSVLEVVRQDYIRTARAKGVPYGMIVRRHILRNALIPTVTVIGIQLGELLSGTIVIENIYAWPGVGRLLIQAINSRDMSMMIACVIVFAVFVSFINLFVDILYSLIDPRISLN
ncbi:MAG: ABC transporter permease [Clostridia bacterium]|nr:ABC transporter permease [Clostridia bacterium]